MTDPPQATIAELLQRSARQDRDAFGQLYDLSSARVHGVVLRVLRDPSMAEEVTQEVYLQVWRGAAAFDGSSSGWGWLMAIAHRRAVDAVRASQAARRRDDVYAVQEHTPPAPGPEDAVVLASQRAQVRTCLDELSPVQRPALELAYWRGLTQAQISEELGVTLGTIKSRLRDGLRRLARCLERGIA